MVGKGLIKILTIIGARPQIIKSAALSRLIRTQFKNQVCEVVVHTGQHYDQQLSAIFFDELSIPRSDYNLQVGSGKQGAQTSKMIVGIERVIEQEKPDFLVIYGDTNSTLAGAIAGAKLHVPIVHIEAGLRSFNKQMPEEINRILSDHVSTYLFIPTLTGYANLMREGFQPDTPAPFTSDNPGLFVVGDVMLDNTLYWGQIAQERSHILDRLSVSPNGYVLATVHRDMNTDNPNRLQAIFDALHVLAHEHMPVVMPLHPRTRRQMNTCLTQKLHQAIQHNSNFRIIEPVSYLDMLRLEQEAALIITDSGGVQKEAYFVKKNSLILRRETEWTEIVETGAARLCDADSKLILDEFMAYRQAKPIHFQPLYGSGNTAERILTILLQATSV